jgi:hypothetical protein
VKNSGVAAEPKPSISSFTCTPRRAASVSASRTASPSLSGLNMYISILIEERAPPISSRSRLKRSTPLSISSMRLPAISARIGGRVTGSVEGSAIGSDFLDFLRGRKLLAAPS